jgi:hypothetical protein
VKRRAWSSGDKRAICSSICAEPSVETADVASETKISSTSETAVEMTHPAAPETSTSEVITSETCTPVETASASKSAATPATASG